MTARTLISLLLRMTNDHTAVNVLITHQTGTKERSFKDPIPGRDPKLYVKLEFTIHTATSHFHLQQLPKHELETYFTSKSFSSNGGHKM